MPYQPSSIEERFRPSTHTKFEWEIPVRFAKADGTAKAPDEKESMVCTVYPNLADPESLLRYDIAKRAGLTISGARPGIRAGAFKEFRVEGYAQAKFVLRSSADKIAIWEGRLTIIANDSEVSGVLGRRGALEFFDYDIDGVEPRRSLVLTPNEKFYDSGWWSNCDLVEETNFKG